MILGQMSSTEKGHTTLCCRDSLAAAGSPEKLASRTTRNGTFNADLTVRIGD